MSLNVEVRTGAARPGPQRALSVSCRFRWYARFSFLLNLHGRVSLGGRVLSDEISLENVNWMMQDSTLMKTDGEFHGHLSIRLSTEAIRFIEEQRKQQKDQDVGMQIELWYQYQEALPTQDQQQRTETFVFGHVRRGQTNIPFHIPHSEGLKRLKEFQWSETELFEVAALPLYEDKNLTEALRLLGEAQVALRGSDHKGVFVKCREALESAAKYESEGDTRRGFELLFARAFPEHSVKQEVINKLVLALSEYAHTLGRHAQYPALHVSPAEAEFAMTACVGLFSLISRRLADKETV